MLEIKNLCVSFSSKNESQWTSILRNLNLELKKGEALGLVGESGSGKSVTSFAVMSLLPDYAKISGDIRLFGKPWLSIPEKEKTKMRGSKIAMIFQDPLSSLDPCFTIEDQITEVIVNHTNIEKNQIKNKVLQTLDLVGIPDPESRLKSYPHQLSGGMSQRIMIAMALAAEPELIIADEPTTALDVTIQKQILILLQNLRKQKQLSLILISHDLGLIAENTDRMAVMYAGEIVETGPVDEIINRPQHPYTISLLNSLPSRYGEIKKGFRIPVMKGSVPNLQNRPSGCQFHPRCEFAQKICSETEVEINFNKNNFEAPPRGVRCLFPTAHT
jgi:oligopeptide/dipeptide ABC transporter ATP-binding protein